MVNGPTNAGRIEVYSNARWIPVCDENFERPDALVVCRQLGYTNVSRHYCCSHYGIGLANATTYLTDLNCTGQERSLDQCSYNIATANSCSPNTIASVECIGKYFTLPVRSMIQVEKFVYHS